MRIGVNARFLLNKKMEGFGWYTYETFSRITKSHPEHEFVFFFDRPYHEKFIFSENITPVVLYPPTRHPILQVIWLDWSIKRALKKHQCDLFVSPDGYLSLTSDVPQVGVIHDLNFEHNPEGLPKGLVKFLKNKFPQFAQKAQRLCTVSNFSKKDIVQTYQIPEDKIDVTYNGAAEIFQPLSEEAQEKIRKKYTNGKPYVLFVGAIHKRKNLPRLLKAFKNLKKEGKIPHQLLIVGEPMWKNQAVEIEESDKEFIYFTGHLPLNALAEIMASASCLAYVSYFEGFGIPLVEAMQSGTPVLAGNKTSLPEIGGDAVIYCDPYAVEDIQKQLEKILTDEALQAELRKKGLERAKAFSWDFTARDLWKAIEKIKSGS